MKNDSAVLIDLKALKEPVKFIITGNSSEKATYTCVVTDTDQVKC